MKHYIIAFTRFFKNNFLKIILGTIFITIFIVAIQLLPNEESDITEEHNENEDLNVEEAENIIHPAIFQFFIENINEIEFTNNALIEQYITLPEVLENASLDTDTNLDEIVEETGNVFGPNPYPEYNMRIIGIDRNPNSNLNTLYVNIGNESDNLSIANYFSDFITEDMVPFLADKNIYTFNEPTIVNEEYIANNQSLPVLGATTAVTDKSDEDEFSSFNILIALFVSILISTLIIIVYNFYSKKLKNFMFYTIKDNDYFILVDKRINYEEDLNNVMVEPSGIKRVVLQEQKLKTNIEEVNLIINQASKEQFIQVTDNFMLIESPEGIERLIFMVEENVTSRIWYDKQRKLAETYNIPTVVIHVNRID